MIGDQVSDAFDLLVDELSLVIGELRRQIADASTSAELDEIDTILRDAKSVDALMNEVRRLEAQWSALLPSLETGATLVLEEPVSATEGGAGVKKRNLGRVPRGTKTSEPVFRRPILEVLEVLGGQAEIGQVFGELEKRFADKLTEVDLQPLPSDSNQLRWRNTAQWARNALVQDGLMERPRRRGIWEISEAGRYWLAENHGP